MRIIKNTILIILILILRQNAGAQGFANLNFENATFVIDPSGAFYPYSVYASNAIPGWTAYISGIPQTDVLSNNITLGDAAISLQGTNGFEPALAGHYSILLQATFFSTQTNSAAIGQTGLIPGTAQSLVFFGNTSLSGIANDMEITFNGSNVPYFAIGSGAGYTIYGANISGFAGDTGQLLFTTYNNTYAELDNIQFSSSAVPEPSGLALGALGILLLGLRRWWNSSR